MTARFCVCLLWKLGIDRAATRCSGWTNGARVVLSHLFKIKNKTKIASRRSVATAFVDKTPPREKQKSEKRKRYSTPTPTPLPLLLLLQSMAAAWQRCHPPMHSPPLLSRMRE